MHHLSFLAAGIIAVSASFGAIAAPAPDSAAPRHEKFHTRMVKELGLSADQAATMEKLHEEGKTYRKEHAQKIKELLKKSKEELLKSAPDKSVLYAYAKESGELRRVMAEHEADHLLKVKAVLTPEQFKKLLTIDHGKKHERFHGGFGKDPCAGCPHKDKSCK